MIEPARFPANNTLSPSWGKKICARLPTWLLGSGKSVPESRPGRDWLADTPGLAQTSDRHPTRKLKQFDSVNNDLFLFFQLAKEKSMRVKKENSCLTQTPCS